MNTKYFGKRANKARLSERAEAMPAAIITAIISSMLLLGIASVVSLVVQQKGESEGNVALATVVSNIDVSLRSDVTQASYITASAKLKQPTARLLTPTDVLLSGVNMHIPATNGECKVVRWSINGTTASRDLTVYKTSTKTESFVKCDETSPVLAKRTKVFAKDVDVKAPFKFNNQVGRPIAFTLDSASLTKANTELEKKLAEKGVEKLSDTDFNELNKLMSTDSYTPGFADACVMNATKVNGVCPEAEADTVAAAWGSLKIAKVSVAFEITNNGGETAKRDIEQNSSVPLYSNAAEAEAAVASASADSRPASPVPSVVPTVTLGTNYTINWTAGGACPVDMVLNYKLYENNILVASQPTRNFTKNYTNSATEFLNYAVQTDCTRGALVISSDMSAVATTKVIPAVPTLSINTQPAATNAALNSNLTSTAVCLYGTSPRYNIIQAVASYGAAGTTVANVTTVNRPINSGFTVVEGASYQYKVEAWCISAYDKSSLTNASTNTFSTLINAPAAAPAFTAPLQGASNIAVNAPVTWNPVVCATGTTTQYEVAKNLNAGAAITPAVVNAWSTALSVVSNNTQGNTVGYSVAARCHGTAPAGVDSVPTAPGTVSYTTVINVPAVAPVFTSPAANATDIATNATVTWSAVTCPTATTTQYFTTKNLNGNIGISPATVIDSWTTDVSLVSANTQGSTVGYTVAARCAGPNANSGASATNTLKYTTMVAAPATPLFTAPAEGATNIATNAAVTWGAATCATGTIPKYFTTKNIDKNVAITSIVIDNWTANRTLTTSNTEGTTVGYTLAARCEGPNAVSVGSANDAVKFTTLINAPVAPAFTAPLANATDIATNATVLWNSVICATGATTKYYATKNVNAGLTVTPTVIDNWTTNLSLVSSNTQGNTVGYTIAARCDGPNANSASSATNTVRYTTDISAPNVPAIVAPINGSTDIPLTATVTWNAATCATGTTAKYFAVKNRDKNAVIPDVTVVNYTTALSVSTTNTEGNRVGYGVKARCDGPNAVSSDGGWGFTQFTTMVQAPTGVPVFTAPAANATAVATNAAVTWSGVTCTTGMTPKYYMTKDINAGVAVTPAVLDNWTIDLSYVSNNTQGNTVGYTVAARCDGPNASSASTATSTLKYTTMIAVPAIPAFTAPLANAVDVATNATVTWGAVTCATGTTPEYYLSKKVDRGVAMSSSIYVWTANLSYVSNNTQGNLVGYNVAAHCVGPNATSSATTDATLRYTTMIAAPAKPYYTSPAEGATNVATNVTLTWGAVSCAPGTITEYYTTKNMNAGAAIAPSVMDAWNTDLTYVTNNTQGNRVGYTVKAHCDGPNADSVDSATDTLTYTTAISAPATPLFTAPAEGATNVAVNAAVTWSVTCPASTTAKYYLTKNIDKNVAMATPTVLNNWTSAASYVSSNTEGTTVGYTVMARCDGPNANSASSAADALKFTTIMNAPVAPAFTAPANGAIDIATNAAVTWGTVTCATGGTPKYYAVKNVDKNVTVTDTVLVNYTTALTLTSANTQGNTVGYGVRARCDGPNANSVAGAWEFMKYTTMIAAPAKPYYTSPAEGATNVATNATLTWGAVTCATGTTTEYYTTKNMNAGAAIAPSVMDAWNTDLTYVTNNTQGNRVGYTVKAHCDGPNADSVDSPTDTLTYTTAISAPTGVPLFTAPAEGAINIATNANVTWSGVTCPASTTPRYYTTKNINAGATLATPTVIDNWTADLFLVSANTQGNTVGYTVIARCAGPNADSASTVADALKYTTAISNPTVAPRFTAPAEAAMDIPTTATATWSAAVCAASTAVEYYTTKNMNAGVAIATPTVIDNWSSSTGTSLATSNTQGNKVGYTVAARCAGPNANSGSSSTGYLTYTTAISAPAMPVFTSPAEGATNVATNATVTWSVVTCAPSTTVKYYTTKNMQNGVAAGPYVVDNWTAGNTLSNANPEGNRLGYTVAARCDGPNDVSASSATDSLTYTTAITAPATPLFTSPAEGAMDIATNATVAWSAAVCGTGATAKYYTTKNIDKNVAITPVVIDNYTTGTTLATSNTEGTTVGYTVRARCDGANAISTASTSDALKYTTIMNAPSIPTFASPLANAMDVATNVAVTWNAVTCATGGTVQYYTTKNVNGNVTMATPTVIDNWSSTTGTSLSTSNTQGNTVGYTIQARCVGPNDTSVSSGMRSLKYTTAINAPAEPIFTSPAVDETNVATNATVTWSAVTCATGTTVKYYTTKDMDRGATLTTPTVIDSWTTGNTLTTSNTQGNRVGYTVKARCDGPNDVSPSSTTEYVKYITVINAPAKPYYTSPAEAATNVATNVTLTWGAVTCPTGTTTEYYTTKNMNAGAAIAPSVMDAWNTDLTYVTNNTQGNRVGYTVKAHCDGPNADSADSATDTLTFTTTIVAPAEPKFITPTEGQMDVATNAAVTWGAAVCASGTTAQYYTTKYNDKDVNLATPTVIDNWSSTTGTSLSTSNTQGTTVGYTLAARCVGPNVTSGSSTTDYVKYTTIMNAPAKPMFTTPAEGATGIATNAAVNWNAVTCATGGTVQYYTKKNVEKGVTMTTPTVIDNWSSSTGTSLSTSNTQGNTVGYTVEARCVGPNDTSVSSGIDSLKYTTVINAPAKPYYTSPAEGAMDVATNVTLTWGAVTCPTGTTTEYYTTKNWNAGVIDTTPSVIDSWNTDLTYVTNNTQGNNVGYTVKAHCDGPNADSADSATDTLKFTTKISNPTVAPVFTSPAEGSVDIATNATVRWSAATCATGTTAKYYTTKYWDKGVADTTPYVMDNWTTSVSYVTNNKQGYQVGYTVKARCDGPNDVSGSTGTDYLKYTTKVTAPAAVSSWNDGGLTVGWGSETCAAEANIYYRVVDRKINNSTVANYGAWQPEGQWGNTSWVAAWPSVKNGYPQWADVQAKCVGANDESSVTASANTTKWIRNFSVSFSASIMPQPGGLWRRMTVDAACPVDTTLDGVWVFIAGNGWGSVRTPGNQIQTDEGHWIDGSQLGTSTGGNSGWVELSRTQNTQWIDTTANWGASGKQGWGARVTGNDMHGTYWNAVAWGNYAYWWYGTCETPYAKVGNIGSHWENQDGTNTIRNMGDPGTRHNAALNGMQLTSAGTTALQ